MPELSPALTVNVEGKHSERFELSSKNNGCVALLQGYKADRSDVRFECTKIAWS